MSHLLILLFSATSPKHRLEFLIGDHVLPYNMTVYQAVKQFVAHGGTEVGDLSDGDADTPFGNTSLWVHTHTIWLVNIMNISKHYGSFF